MWSTFDHLKSETFSPKTFFLLHGIPVVFFTGGFGEILEISENLTTFLDINGDGYIDAFELEAIFQPELDKIWDPNNPEDDMNEMEEVLPTRVKFFNNFQERANMREHVMNEVDTNKDTAISLAEFTAYTQTTEFEKPTNDYVTIDEQIERGELYTHYEMVEYR